MAGAMTYCTTTSPACYLAEHASDHAYGIRDSWRKPICAANITRFCGAVAQLGERHVRIVEVVGSIPIRSTTECFASVTQDPGNRATARLFFG